MRLSSAISLAPGTWFGGLAVLALLTNPHPAAATTILEVSGSTLGCFDAGCSNYTSTAQSSGYYELSFTGTSFDVFSDVSGSALNFDLGTIERGNARISSSVAPLPFTLEVVFTLPTGIDGSQGDTFSALITGTNYGGGGKVGVDFNNDWQLLTFTTALGYGSLEFSVLNDFLLNNNGDGTIYGGIRNATYTSTPGESVGGQEEDVPGGPEPGAALPEPATLMLFATGIGAAVLRRRNPRTR